MTAVKVLTPQKAKGAARITRNSRIFKSIIKAIEDKKGENIIALDLKKIPEAVADYFIICEAGSTTQVKAIADAVEIEVKKQCGEPPYKHEGRQGLNWVLVDYVHIVVHIFLPATRKFYKLEEMWSDAALHEYGR